MSHATVTPMPDPVTGDEQPPVLLVADPEADLAALADYGIVVLHSRDGLDALLQIGTTRPDVILISAHLPSVDLVALIRTLRRNRDVPIILGAGPADAEIAVQGLQAGATACVAIPYRGQELLPIIQSARGESSLTSIRVGDIELDRAAHVVRLRGRVVHVPLREFELLQFLMANNGRVVTREEIAHKVWRSTTSPPNNTIAVHVKRLRARLGDDEKNPSVIRTVRGLGYRFTAPDAD
ncbi:response regulator transcription factor [Nonomuraea africana]|uniref:DNA-binding response OmpR family regulator n=1 Tax=Nonomuraea africana TaxID=46171 RepID=A0ABR9KV81_9ACTN|nr:response regulator transcription factor [Nonomuraea africana]MBE1565940.1 DNA-binding response OmpR family regulator [Nonomuraea africana]